MLQKACIRSVKDRIRLEKAISKNIEILKTEVKAPVFILGLPRTGTTFLQNLLFQDKRFRHLHYWEQVALGPQPTLENLQENFVIDSSLNNIKKLRKIAPEFFIAHEINPWGPEECNGLMEREFTSIIYFMFRNIPTYMDWFVNKDMSNTYRCHRRQLQYLGYNFNGMPWVLKAPAHLFFLKYLLQEYPDARILHLHRDPLDIIPSMSSLGVISRQILSNSVDVKATGRQFLEMIVKNINNSIDYRNENPQLHIMDIAYNDLVADTANTSKNIYNWLGVELTSDVDVNISNWLTESKRKRAGKPHLYSLDQFGLDDGDVKNKFSQYYEKYSAYISG